MKLHAAAAALLLLPSGFLFAQNPQPSHARLPRPMSQTNSAHPAIVIDTHADTPQRFLDENYDLAQPLNGGQLNLESAKQGGLGAEFFSIWVEPDLLQGSVRPPHA